ncbi:unnamed protein product, partial [Meganyctiphanes norvegica]
MNLLISIFLHKMIHLSFGKPRALTSTQVYEKSKQQSLKMGSFYIVTQKLGETFSGRNDKKCDKKIVCSSIPLSCILKIPVFFIYYHNGNNYAGSTLSHTCMHLQNKRRRPKQFNSCVNSILEVAWSAMFKKSTNTNDRGPNDRRKRVNTLHRALHQLDYVSLSETRPRPHPNDAIRLPNIWMLVNDLLYGCLAQMCTDHTLVKSLPLLFELISPLYYSRQGFTKNGGLTMSTIPSMYQGVIGRHSGLSHRDKRAVNLAYKCIDMWSSNCESKDCEGEGYMGPNCQCVCPPGQNGDRCQHATAKYYTLPSCSQTITEETTLSSPNYPHNIKLDSWCVYEIDAPEGFVPLLTFKDFQLYSWDLSCSEDLLQIRHSNYYDGDVLCGELIPGAQILGSISHMVLYLDVKSSYSRGFHVKVT